MSGTAPVLLLTSQGRALLRGSGLRAGASHHEHPVAVAVFGEPQGQPSLPALPELRLLGIVVAQPCAWRQADTVSVGGGAWGPGSGSRGLGHKPPWQEGGMPEQSRGQRGQGGPGLSRSGQGEGLGSPRQGSRARSLARVSPAEERGPGGLVLAWLCRRARVWRDPARRGSAHFFAARGRGRGGAQPSLPRGFFPRSRRCSTGGGTPPASPERRSGASRGDDAAALWLLQSRS